MELLAPNRCSTSLSHVPTDRNSWFNWLFQMSISMIRIIILYFRVRGRFSIIKVPITLIHSNRRLKFIVTLCSVLCMFSICTVCVLYLSSKYATCSNKHPTILYAQVNIIHWESQINYRIKLTIIYKIIVQVYKDSILLF